MEPQNKKMPAARYQYILDWLDEEEIISIQELQQRLEVSHMTVHRDLDYLAAQDRVRKVRGGVMRMQDSPYSTPQSKNCDMCGSRVSKRTEVIIHRQNGDRIFACCPHCGIMMIKEPGNDESVLARDFIYGRMVNMFQAFYVVDSDVRLCCVPSTLCFVGRSDARRFQRGFEGRVLNFAEVRAYLMDIHQHHSQRDNRQVEKQV